MTGMNRFTNFFGNKEEKETPVIPFKPKEEQVATTATSNKKVEYPKFELDASKPYAGIVEQVWGKPKLDEEGIKQNNRVIKTQGVADMLRLVGEAITGSMGGDIVKRGTNKVSAQAAADNKRLMDIFRTDKARYNAMKMQEMLKNMDYNIRQGERKEDREWAKTMFEEQTKAANDRMNKQFAHSDKVTAENRKWQEGVTKTQNDFRKQLAGLQHQYALGEIGARVKHYNRGNVENPNSIRLVDEAGVPHYVPRDDYSKYQEEALKSLTLDDKLLRSQNPKAFERLLQSRIVSAYRRGANQYVFGSENNGQSEKKIGFGATATQTNTSYFPSVTTGTGNNTTNEGQPPKEPTRTMSTEEEHREIQGEKLYGYYNPIHTDEETRAAYNAKYPPGSSSVRMVPSYEDFAKDYKYFGEELNFATRWLKENHAKNKIYMAGVRQRQDNSKALKIKELEEELQRLKGE